jgi:TPR repeat protein
LGEYYLNGRKGVEKNQAEAEQCFQKAIGIIEKMKKPSPEMLWVGGRCIKNMFPKSYRSRKNARKAFLMFKQATDQNYPAAQCDLGECYFQGYSVRQSTKTGINMIKMAAAKGCARAQALEASYYLSGGKGSDISKALKLLKSSIQKNDAVGEYCLGLAYEKGIGLEKNIEKSRYWLQKSADQGYDKAQLKLQK